MHLYSKMFISLFDDLEWSIIRLLQWLRTASWSTKTCVQFDKSLLTCICLVVVDLVGVALSFCMMDLRFVT